MPAGHEKGCSPSVRVDVQSPSAASGAHTDHADHDPVSTETQYAGHGTVLVVTRGAHVVRTPLAQKAATAAGCVVCCCIVHPPCAAVHVAGSGLASIAARHATASQDVAFVTFAGSVV